MSSYIHYVSPRHKESILDRDAKSSCGPGEGICWGTGRQRKGYACCNKLTEICAHDASGRPICRPSPAFATAVMNKILSEKDLYAPHIGDLVGSYV